MAGTNYPGLTAGHVTINGENIIPPRWLDPVRTIRQWRSETAAGTVRIVRKWEGAGLPDVLDRYEFAMEYDLGKEQSTAIDFLERLRVLPGPHDFAYWKQVYVAYTATSGQQEIYLPRPDAFSKGYVGHDDDAHKAIIAVDGAPVTVVYKTSVTLTDTPAAGEVWISNTSVKHPSSGTRVALAKFGTPLSAGAVVLVKYYPLFRVIVEAVVTKAFEKVAREDKAVVLSEAA